MKVFIPSLLVLLLFSCTDYSDGFRAGNLVKFSRKGAMFKTYEGTLNLGGLKAKSDKDGNQSYVANTWDFSLDEYHHRGENIKALADSLNKALDIGRPVKLHYHEESCTDWLSKRGSTGYYVDSVIILY